MIFDGDIPKNYYCYFNQSNMGNTDWKIQKQVSDGVSTYVYQQKREGSGKNKKEKQSSFLSMLSSFVGE